MTIDNVAVIGAGTMGNGIAHVFAVAGYKVMLIDSKPGATEKALLTIKANLDRQTIKGIITADAATAAFMRIKAGAALEDAQSAELVVEAVFEDAALKCEVFSTLDRVCPPHTILTSNTSSLPIGDIAKVTKRPAKVMGMHFMNPVPVMKLLELVRASATADETASRVREVAVKLGKIPVESKDFPGFIANRILMPMINEACYALMEGVASKEDIDTTMKLGMNHPMGPLTLADFIGLDVCLAIMQVLHRGFGNDKYKPCALLEEMVRKGKLGKKSGEGFYRYA
ncbi:MAG: 3-hydroxyacyl-CoA dehydrogenase NAD-binding domain-containing protein [Elusimicrobiota bacterium]